MGPIHACDGSAEKWTENESDFLWFEQNLMLNEQLACLKHVMVVETSDAI